MRPRTIVLVALALVFGASAALGIHRWQKARQAAARVDTVPVLTAAVDVPRGSSLTAKTVKVQHWPRALAPQGALSKPEDVAGRTALNSLVPGEPVLEGKMASQEAGRSLSSLVPAGKRAFAIRTPHVASGVGGFVRPDDRVDVLLTTTNSRDDVTGGSVTTTLLQNIAVLAVNEEMDAAQAAHPDKRNAIKTVTLLVEPDQAAMLALASDKGQLHLSLRNLQDPHQADTQPATMKHLRFHQDPPRGPSTLATVVGHVAGAMASAAVTANVPPAKPAQRSVAKARIQTLRGVQRGTVHVQWTK